MIGSLKKNIFYGIIFSAVAMLNAYALESGERIKVEGEGPLYRGMNNYASGFVDTSEARGCMLVWVTGCSADKGSYYVFKPVRAGNAKSAPAYSLCKKVAFDGELKAFFKDNKKIGRCKLLKLPDGRMGAFIFKGGEVARAIFNPDTITFEKAAEPLKKIGMAVPVMRDDGSIDIYEIASKVVVPTRWAVDKKGRPARPWTEDYQPFDGAGVTRDAVSMGGITHFTLPNFFSDERGEKKLVSKGYAEILGANDMASFVGDDGKLRLLVGTNYGSMVCYIVNPDGTLSEKTDCKIDDLVFRGPAFGASCAVKYSGKNPDLYSGGESGIYFYKFKKYADDGAPVYAEGKLVLEDGSPDLYAASLPVAQVVDFDGDGLQDIVSGNSLGEIWFFKNIGESGAPKFAAGEPLTIYGEKFAEKSGYWGIQGPIESQWGYVSPCVYDWNGDGLWDLITGDSTQRFGVYFNRGTKEKPDFLPRKNLFCNGLEVHGTWRTRPAVAKLGDGTVAYVISDDQNHAHLWRRIDDLNVKDCGKLRLKDGSPISMSFPPSSGTGRSKYMLRDVDGDGKTDLLIGTPIDGSVPNKENGLPYCLTKDAKPRVRIGASVVWLKNVGDDANPVFDTPRMMRFKGDIAKGELTQFGVHECAADVADFGGGLKGIIVSAEEGQIYFYKFEDLVWETFDEIKSKPFKVQNPEAIRSVNLL